MTAAGTRLRADMLWIVSGVPGLFHEDRKLLLWCELVQHVVEQASEDPVPAVALRDPESSFSEAETTGKLDELGVGRDDLVECRVSPGDGERFGFGRRPVSTHLRPRGTALRLQSHSGSDRNGHSDDGAPGRRVFHGRPLLSFLRVESLLCWRGRRTF